MVRRHNPESAAAPRPGMNIVANMPAGGAAGDRAAYWQRAQAAGAHPKLGLNRFIVLAETDEEALAIARRAYRRWWASFMALWNKHSSRRSG